MPLAAESRPLTAFSTPEGLFQFRSSPFGLINSEGGYNRVAGAMKRDVNDGEFHVYVDDELLASNCEFEKHLKKLEKVFLAHRKFGVLVNTKKTNLMVREVEFLGFQISQKGIFPVKGWAEKVENWPLPSTKKGLTL